MGASWWAKLRSMPVGVTPREGLAAAGIGLLSAASLPPLGHWLLSLPAVALFLLLIRDRASDSARNLGLLYGLVYGLGTMYWLFGIFGFLAIPLVALFAGYFGILATLIGLTRDRPPLVRALLAGLFAIAIEWLRGDAWYLRFPWYTVPHALAAAPDWIAPARWLGVYGLSFAIWFVAGLGAFVRPAYWLAFFLLPATSLLLLAFAPPDRRAVLVQVEENFNLDQLLSRIPTQDVELVVLPEYAYSAPPAMVLKLRNGPADLARRLSCPVVFGAVEQEPEYRNLAAVLSPDGAFLGTFTKQRPVPLFHDGIPGTERPVFSVGDGVLGVAICYDYDAPEVAASLARQGATVLVDPTFDSMRWGRVQHVHHELLVRLRAVETDRWVLRAASSGRTEVVDPHGYPSADGIDHGETGFITLDFGHRDTFALGSQLYLLGPAAAALTGLFIVVALIRGAARRRQPSTTGLRVTP